MSDETFHRWRIAIALVAGLLIVALALSMKPMGRSSPVAKAQLLSVQRLQRRDREVREFRNRYHRLPKSLVELSNSPYGESVESGANIDGWARPLTYTVRGDKYSLTSYGADGKRGGEGPDHDLLPTMSMNDLPEGPFWEVLWHPAWVGVRLTAVGSGLLAFLLTFAILRPRDFAGFGIGLLVVKMIVTLFAATIVAAIVSFMHYPVGH